MALLRNFQVNLMSALCFVFGSFMVSPPTTAQNNRVESAAVSTHTKNEFAFEILSIHPHEPGTGPLTLQYLPNGYIATVTLRQAIMLAYIPQPGYKWSSSRIVNAPDWVANDWYDIDARVAQEDVEAWKQAQDGYDSELLKSAWRAALRERCKLAFHMTAVEVPYLNLVIGKHGAKLEATVPGAVKPVKGKSYSLGKGFYVQDVGKVQFVGVSMEEFARYLMRLDKDHPIQDKSGLAGRYDFTLPLYEDNSMADPLAQILITGIGLELKAGKGPGFIIYIDHIERPDPN